MTDEYERQEFWFNNPKKDEISILGKDLFKCSNEELKYLGVGDSLANIITTKEEADDFMNQLNFAIKQGNKKI